MEANNFAKLFDHSIVRPDASRVDVAHFAARLGTATLTRGEQSDVRVQTVTLPSAQELRLGKPHPRSKRIG